MLLRLGWGFEPARVLPPAICPPVTDRHPPAHATLIVEYGTRRRFISPLHDPAVRRKCPGRRFYSDRCRRSLQRPSRHRLPLDEDLPAVLRRPPARPRRIRPRPPR